MKLKPLLLITSLALNAVAGPLSFDFKDPKGVNTVSFKLDAPLEAISGSAQGVTGTINFDPEHPEATRGKIVIAAASLNVPNGMMKEHMLGANWLDAAKHPEITFEAKDVKNARTEGDTTTADVAGTFTLKGVARDITVPVKLTYLKDKLGARVPNQKGDLLVVRANFSIKRSDFNIMAGQNEDKVSNAIDLPLSIAGSCPR